MDISTDTYNTYYVNNFEGMFIKIKFNKLLSGGRATIATSLGTITSSSNTSNNSLNIYNLLYLYI